MNPNLLSWLSHALITALCGLIGLLLGSLPVGLAAGLGFYFGREVAQHERKTKGSAARGFMFWSWSRDAQLDMLFSIIAAVLMLIVL